MRAGFSIMDMPKAAVNKDCFTLGTENEVRLAGQFLGVQPITVAQAINDLANNQLRRCVLAPYPPHILRSL
jgi:hypothetical protein